MILVDTSALIEFYRPAGDAAARAAVAAAITEGEVAVNGIVQVEILAFARTEEDRRKLAADLEAFHHLELSAAEFDLAGDLGFRLRRLGVNVPATDLIIASSALRADATLYHLDAHFDAIAEHSELRSLQLGPARSIERGPPPPPAEPDPTPG